MGPIVACICKDPGGTNGVLPVIKELRAQFLEALPVANGKAVEILNASKTPFFHAPNPEDLLAWFDLCAVLTSMCSEGGTGRNLIPLLKDKTKHGQRIPVIALQDFWGGRLWTEWADPKFRPDYICVNDQIGADIVLRAWPDFQKENVLITGFPAMDKYVHVDIVNTKLAVKSTLGLSEDRPLVFYAGQIEREGELINEVVKVLNEINSDIYFLPRQHPRMKNNAPEELPKWDSALANFRGGILIDSSPCDTPSVTMAADLVMSTFSTVNVEATCLRKNNISILYPELGMQLFKKELPQLNESPLVELGCSAKATDREELTDLIEKSLANVNGLGLQEAQEQHFPLDGRNAQRVAEFIHTIL